MKCEFSERNYEKSLDYELSKGPFFSPNPIQENALGIDSSTLTDNPDFWRLWNPDWLVSPSVPVGADISQYLWRWTNGIGQIQNFPKMRANVFLQYKIPEYITSPSGREYLIWRHPYFRYDITPHQNTALRILENNVGQNAIVSYASPVFSTYDQLMNNCIQRNVISNSNFVKPSTLHNHHRYSYDASGKFGWMHSEPLKTDKVNLIKEITNALSFSKDKDDYVTLKKLSSYIDKTIDEYDELLNENGDSPKENDSEFKTRFLKTKSYFQKINEPKNDDSKYLLNILAFTFQTNLSWFIVR